MEIIINYYYYYVFHYLMSLELDSRDLQDWVWQTKKNNMAARLDDLLYWVT